MITHIPTKALKLPKEYLVADEYLVPTGPIIVTILDLLGDVVGSHTIDQLNGVYLLPNTHLGLVGPELAKSFFLQINFTIDDIDYEVIESLRVIRFKPITVTTTQVRSQVGASIEEMPDASIDIYGSYLELCEKLNADIFSDPSKLLKSNRLILLHTLIKELPTLSLRLLSSRAVDDHKFTRNRINIKEVSAQLNSEYELLLVSDFNKLAEIIDEPLLTIVQRSDPFSGE
jgi:hypothetical protein